MATGEIKRHRLVTISLSVLLGAGLAILCWGVSLHARPDPDKVDMHAHWGLSDLIRSGNFSVLEGVGSNLGADLPPDLWLLAKIFGEDEPAIGLSSRWRKMLLLTSKSNCANRVSILIDAFDARAYEVRIIDKGGSLTSNELAYLMQTIRDASSHISVRYSLLPTAPKDDRREEHCPEGGGSGTFR
jgi:hypothetical protein